MDYQARTLGEVAGDTGPGPAEVAYRSGLPVKVLFDWWESDEWVGRLRSNLRWRRALAEVLPGIEDDLAADAVARRRVWLQDLVVCGGGADEGGEPVTDEELRELTLRTLPAECVERALGSVPARKAAIVKLWFGFEDGRPRTLSAVADEVGLSRERIRQIVQDTKRRLAWCRRQVGDPACRVLLAMVESRERPLGPAWPHAIRQP